MEAFELAELLRHQQAGGRPYYVRAGAVHRFHSIVEELRVLVFFAPAEGSRALDV